MKNLFIVYGAIMLNIVLAYGQNQSMTISHSGLAPNDTLWVYPGEPIDFIYGGGGVHPMTSGQGGTTSPIFFPTVTVSASISLSTFSLNEVGTYIFHCGTNPNNQANWGTIIVEESNAIQEDDNLDIINVYPNPATNMLTIDVDSKIDLTYSITDMNGKELKIGIINSVSNSIDISNLESGVYVIAINIEGEVFTEIFRK